MAMIPRLELRQGKSLVMTPQLQQAIKLLQLSNVELTEFVEAELERNPLLEREEGQAEAPKQTDGGDAQALDFDSGATPVEAALDVSVADMAPDLSQGDLAEAGAAPLTDWSRASSGKSFDDLPGLEETLANELTLAEHLDAQLTEAGLDPVERMIGGVLIDLVDDWGYMRGDLREIAARIGASERQVAHVLAVMQGFEPTGVMARDIPECLALQLKERGRFDPAMEKLLGHLDMLAKGRNDRRGARADAQARRRLRRRRGAVDRAGCLCKSRPGRRLAGRTQHRRHAARADEPALLRHRVEKRSARRGQTIPLRMRGQCLVAGQEPRPARPHHPQSRSRNRAPAGRLLRAWRRPFAAAQSKDRRRRDRDA